MKKAPGKNFIDAYSANQRSESEAWWWLKLIFFAVSGFIAFKVAEIETITGIIRLSFAIYSLIVVIGVIFFLSTKFIFKGPFGGMRSGSWWDGF